MCNVTLQSVGSKNFARTTCPRQSTTATGGAIASLLLLIAITQNLIVGAAEPRFVNQKTTSGRPVNPNPASDDLKNPGPDEPDFPSPRIWLDRDGVLRIQGTQDNDDIRVFYDAGGTNVCVDLNNMEDSFPVGDVVQVIIYALAGDDDVTNDTAITDILWGGLGDDNVYGGSGVTFAYGQGGTDIIDGRNGNDILDGGDDTDYVFGGNGSDIVMGGNGIDVVSGGHPNNDGADGSVDLLIGGAGGDFFRLPKDPAEVADVWDDFNLAEGDQVMDN